MANKDHNTSPTLIAILALCIALFGSLTTYTVNKHQAQNISRSRREVATYFCASIEQLKARVRQRATDDYKNLDKNGKLLHIKVTPELRQASLEALTNTLQLYAPVNCKLVVEGKADPIPTDTTSVQIPPTSRPKHPGV